MSRLRATLDHQLTRRLFALLALFTATTALAVALSGGDAERAGEPPVREDARGGAVEARLDALGDELNGLSPRSQNRQRRRRVRELRSELARARRELRELNGSTPGTPAADASGTSPEGRSTSPGTAGSADENASGSSEGSRGSSPPRSVQDASDENAG
jgi:hypothetical protein